MKRIDKAYQDWKRTNELMKIPGVKISSSGRKHTIQINFCPVHYMILINGCTKNKTGWKDCIACWNKGLEEDLIDTNKQ